MICPPLYMGKNPSGPKPLNPLLFSIDSYLCKPDGLGEGRSCIDRVS